MQLSFWLYTSRSLILGAEARDVLPSLVSHWQKSNHTAKISGALIFTGFMFSQYIEGPEKAIAELREKIMADDRHTEVRTTDKGASQERMFKGWTLAYSGQAAPFDRLVLHAHGSQ